MKTQHRTRQRSTCVHAGAANGTAGQQTPLVTRGNVSQCEYGERYINRVLPNGRVICDVVPLTLEDVLHPREGDHISARPQQILFQQMRLPRWVRMTTLTE